MGRTSMRDAQARARQLLQEQTDVMEQMKPKLRRKVQSWQTQFNDTREQTIRFYYKIGVELREVRNDEETYGKNPLGQAEAAMPSHKRTLRRCLQFAEMCTPAELEALLALEHTESGFRLTWGHIQYLLIVKTEKKRMRLAEQAVRNMMDPHALHAQVKKQNGQVGHGGRPHAIPQSVHMQIRQIVQVSNNWVKKSGLWNGDDVNVFENILNSPPDELTDDDAANLIAAQEAIENIRSSIPVMLERLEQCKLHVDRVLRVRAEQQEAAAALEAGGTTRRARGIQVTA